MPNIKNSITHRYVLALSIIAILSTIAFYTLHTVLKSSKNTGYIVNISGKQRMLSQHIALDVHRIHNALSMGNHMNLNSSDKQILKQHTKEMLNANKILSFGVLPSKRTIELSQTVQEMYFGDMNLSQRVVGYVDLAEKVLKVQKHEEIDELIKKIDELSEPLLIDLNKVVKQYEFEGEVRLSQLQTLETAAWILTIITLLLEVIFIFQPMVRTIVNLSAENRAQIDNLSKEVELRTIHLERANSRLRELASHDPLTGLRNRLTLEADIDKAINSYKMHHAPYAVVMIDIDWFKKVNDTYGHDVGDVVLIELSNILLHSLREGDKVYRAGGEEFVILLNRVTLQEAQSISEKMRLIIQDHHFKTDGTELQVTISAGLYHSSILKVDDVKTLLKLVDSALYCSKHSGRNTITNVDEELECQGNK